MAEEVTFDRSLYLPEAVEAAAAAYAEHARVDVRHTDDSIVAVISPAVEDEAHGLVNAFCNHVLHETIARLRQSTLQESV
jgi:hypothetical protein